MPNNINKNYSPFKINQNKFLPGDKVRYEYEVHDNSPYSNEWAKKILLENYNVLMVVDGKKNKLKLVKPNAKLVEQENIKVVKSKPAFSSQTTKENFYKTGNIDRPLTNYSMNLNVKF